MSRNSKLTPDVADRIVSAVRSGASESAAAEAVGISRSTLSEWLSRGRGEHGRPKRRVYADLVDSIKRARSELIVELTDTVKRGATPDLVPANRVVRSRTTIRRDQNGGEIQTTTIDHDPLAHAKWMLARLDPENWGDRVTHDGRIEGGPSEPTKIDIVFDDGASDPELQSVRNGRIDATEEGETFDLANRSKETQDLETDVK